MAIQKFFHRSGRPFAWTLVPMLLSVPALVQAQTDTGHVTGSITDATGAILPGTSVTLTNVDTGVAQSATSDASGNFNFSAVVRGSYKL